MTDAEGYVFISDGDRTIPGEIAVPLWIRLVRFQ
jgi:hypothetical protein